MPKKSPSPWTATELVQLSGKTGLAWRVKAFVLVRGLRKALEIERSHGLGLEEVTCSKVNSDLSSAMNTSNSDLSSGTSAGDELRGKASKCLDGGRWMEAHASSQKAAWARIRRYHIRRAPTPEAAPPGSKLPSQSVEADRCPFCLWRPGPGQNMVAHLDVCHGPSVTGPDGKLLLDRVLGPSVTGPVVMEPGPCASGWRPNPPSPTQATSNAVGMPTQTSSAANASAGKVAQEAEDSEDSDGPPPLADLSSGDEPVKKARHSDSDTDSDSGSSGDSSPTSNSSNQQRFAPESTNLQDRIQKLRERRQRQRQRKQQSRKAFAACQFPTSGKKRVGQKALSALDKA